jgi:hypothetical protein
MTPLPVSSPSAAPAGVEIVPGDLAALDARRPAVVAAFCYSDVRPLAGALGFIDWRLCGALSRAVESGRFSGARGEILLLPARGRMGDWRVFVFGLGPHREADRAAFREHCREALEVLQRAGVATAAVAAPMAPEARELETEFVHAVAEELRGKVSCVLVDA